VSTHSSPPWGRRLTRRWAAIGALAAVVFVCACSGVPEPPAEEMPAGQVAPSPVTAAQDHLARGKEAREAGEYARAQEEYETATALFEKEQNWEGYVQALNGVGAALRGQGDNETAFDHLDLALATARERLGSSHPAIASTYQEIGSTKLETGRPREALEHYGKALELRRAAAGEGEAGLEVAAVLRRMADAHYELGEDDRALALGEEAEAILRARLGPLHFRLGDALVVKGGILWGLGRYDQAIENLEEAVTILEGLEDTRAQSLAAAYANLGNVYWSKSDYDEALALYLKALPLTAAVLGAEHPHVGLAHFNLAVLYSAKGDYSACIASVERALNIYIAALGERSPRVVQAYNLLGQTLVQKGDPDRALGVLEKALAVQLSLPEAGDRDSAVIYSTLAEAYRARGDHVRAAAHYRKALAVGIPIYGTRHPGVAEDHLSLGELHLEMGQGDEALRFFSAAIAANDPRASGTDLDLAPPFETAFSEKLLLETLQGAARARARRWAKTQHTGDLEAAALVYEHASSLIDRMRIGYRAEGSKLSLAASAKEVYDEAIGAELELHRLTGDEQHLERAFGYAEKSKAGVLRDALNEAEARAFAGLPRELLEEERRLRQDLAAASRRLVEAQTEGGVDEKRVQTLRDDEFALKRDYDALRERFEKEHPDYYDLKYRFETTETARIRERALDGQTVLVEYFLGKEQVFIFTVSARGLEVTSIPRGDIEVEVRRLWDAIQARDPAAFAGSARALYRQLLAQVEERLEGMSLVIVPDGLLSTVPFEALLEDEASADSDALPPFVLRDHAVSYAYSATVLLQGLGQKRQSPTDELVAFAPAVGGGGDASRDALPPLPASRQEVTDVRRLFAKRAGLFGGWFSGRSRVYLGRDATEARLKSAGLEHYRYVHLATHGVVDEKHPGLSRLLLRRQTGSGEDGVLHLGEVYNLRLNADLVVLSACDTGRGRIARGEGIIGLTRGFLYAGAKSLLVSLWPVSDAAAADLVVDFYQELLAGRPRAEALRQAKLRTMGRNPEYAKPYYWSSLVLVGEGR
jgi:CHAT domain-containing protein/Tfp pilus assembly protein PilF